MSGYVRELTKLGLMKKTSSSKWVADTLVVPKRPPAMLRLTLDYRSVNGATVRIFCPMPNIEAELSDVRGSTDFAQIDFCSGYCKLPLAEEIQPLFYFMTTDRVFMHTRTT